METPMSKSDLENKIRSLIQTIRIAIKPELAIPTNELSHPVNYRINRLRAQMAELKKIHEQTSASIAKISTNLEALLEEINPKTDAAPHVNEEAASVKDEMPKTKKPGTKKAQAPKTKTEDKNNESI